MGICKARYRWLTADLAKHYARLYGTRTHDLIGNAKSLDDLGAVFSPLFREREARFLIDNEWASTAEDLLERRTKHGLHMTQAERLAFTGWLERQQAGGLKENGNAQSGIRGACSISRRVSAPIRCWCRGRAATRRSRRSARSGSRPPASGLPMRASATSWCRWRSTHCSKRWSATIPATEKAQDFVISEMNPSGLRPSIETTVHALMPQKVVIHVHCVETIATAVQTNGAAIAAERLPGIPHVFVPYARPGLPLAKAIAERLQEKTSVLILGNHGLAVAAETVADAAILLDRGLPPLDDAATGRRRPPISRHCRALRSTAAIACPTTRDCMRSRPTSKAAGLLPAAASIPTMSSSSARGPSIAAPGETAAFDRDRQRMNAAKALPPLLLFPGKGVLVAEGPFPQARSPWRAALPT